MFYVFYSYDSRQEVFVCFYIVLSLSLPLLPPFGFDKNLFFFSFSNMQKNICELWKKHTVRRRMEKEKEKKKGENEKS